MPLIIQTPENPDVIARYGTYPRAINALSRKQTSVQRHLRYRGLAGYEPMTQATLLSIMQLAPQRSVFFDVGAHVGLYSALVSAVFARAGARSYAFEPTPETAEIGRGIARHNRLSIEVVQAAVSDQPGQATLYFADASDSSNSLNEAFRAHSREVSVPLVTLDSFAAELGRDPHLIKIDVETHETQVLLGARGLIARARPWLVCEVLRDTDRAQMSRLLGWMEGMGYTFHLLTPALPWPSSPAAHYEELLGLSRDWLFAPGPVPARLTDAVRAWLTAIRRCGAQTNLLVPPGGALPAGWNAPYPGRQRLGWLARLRAVGALTPRPPADIRGKRGIGRGL